MSQRNISTNDIILRYIEFIEHTIPLANDCLDYIATAERHLSTAVLQLLQHEQADTSLLNNMFQERVQRPVSQSPPSNRPHAAGAGASRRAPRARPNWHHPQPIPPQHVDTNHQQQNEPALASLLNQLNNVFGGNSSLFQTTLPLFQTTNINNLSPVVVRPSATQIAQACETIRFSNIESPLNNSCPILVEAFQPNDNVMRIRYCGHCFNPDALGTWLQSNVRCPVCRYDIRTHVSQSNTTNNIPPTSTQIQNENNNDIQYNMLYTFHYYTPDASNNNIPSTIVDASNNNV